MVRALGVGMGIGFGGQVLSPVSLALDNLTSAAVYSTRRLRTAYAGPLVRVRRSSDNAEADVGYGAAGWLDEASLLAHVGAGDGFVTTWYDQSGNGRDATQTTAVRQPSIATAGVVRVDGVGNPQVYFDGISHAMNGPVYTAVAPITQNFVFNPSATQVAYAMVLTARPAVQEFRRNATNPQWTQLVNASVSMIDATTGFGVPRVSTTLFGATQSDLYANGSLVATAVAATGNVISGITIGNRTPGNPYQYFGGMGEIIFLPAALSTTDRQTLERNQGVAFGITVA
jgi:trimeric autotransporter adhesin